MSLKKSNSLNNSKNKKHIRIKVSDKNSAPPVAKRSIAKPLTTHKCIPVDNPVPGKGKKKKK